MIWTSGAPLGTALNGVRDGGLTSLPIFAASSSMIWTQITGLSSVLPKTMYFVGFGYNADTGRNDASTRKLRAFDDAVTAAGMHIDGVTGLAWDGLAIVVDALRAIGPDADIRAASRVGCESEELPGHLRPLQLHVDDRHARPGDRRSPHRALGSAKTNLGPGEQIWRNAALTLMDEDHVIVVTGAGGGLGSAMARGLLHAGRRVVGVDIDAGAPGLAELCAGAGRAGVADRLYTTTADIRSADSAREVVSRTLERFERAPRFGEQRGTGSLWPARRAGGPVAKRFSTFRFRTGPH